MADFTIASQVGGGGGGQNAIGGGFNPNSMLQLMQLQQTMQLQRLAEQRAAAAEGRAAALHTPQLQTAQTQATAAQLGLKEKLDEKALSDSFYDLIGKHDNPYAPEVLGSLKKSNPKLYTFMSNRKLEQDKLTAEAQEKTAKSITEQFEYAKKTAPVLLANIDRVKDQATYEKVYDEVAKANRALSTLIPREFSPENVAALKSTLESVQGMSTMSLPGGDVVVTRNGQPVGMVDPTAPNGLRPFGPGEAPRVPAQPQAAAPAAAAPQTMGFSGMGQLTPRTQNAAQNVLSTIPGARITSGLRTPERNAAVGGAKASYHLTGDAFDAVPPAGMPMNVFAAQVRARLEPLGYTVMYGDPGHLDHVHVQPGPGMNVPRQFSPSVAATDIAANRNPLGMEVPLSARNAMAPLAALSLLQQNAMTQPQPTPANIYPALTQPAGGAPRREDYPTYGQFVKAQEEYRTDQRKLAEEQRKADQEVETFRKKEEIKSELGAKPKPLTAVQEKKLRDDIAADYASARSTIATMDDVIKAVEDLRKVPDSDKDAILGFVDARTPVVRRGSIGAQAKLDNLAGQVTAMGKAAASLSGALGNMAVQEWKIVQDQIASIDPTRLDAKELNKQLDIIEAKAKAAASRTRDAYRRQYAEEFDRFGDRFKLPEDGASSGKTPSVEDLLKKYGG